MKDRVEKNNSIPAYQQIKELILRQLKDGSLKPGDCLPSEKEFCETHNVSRITVRSATSSLANEGLLYTVVGKGTFVNEMMQEEQLEHVSSFSAKLRKKNFQPGIKVLEESIIPADRNVARYLKIKLGDKVIKIKRLKLINDIPLFIEKRFIPYRYCPSLIEEGLASASLTKLLKNKYHLKIKHRDIKVKPTIMDVETALLLQVRKNLPGLLVFETLFLENNQPIKWEERIHKSGIHFTSKVVSGK